MERDLSRPSAATDLPPRPATSRHSWRSLARNSRGWGPGSRSDPSIAPEMRSRRTARRPGDCQCLEQLDLGARPATPARLLAEAGAVRSRGVRAAAFENPVHRGEEFTLSVRFVRYGLHCEATLATSPASPCRPWAECPDGGLLVMKGGRSSSRLDSRGEPANPFARQGAQRCSRRHEQRTVDAFARRSGARRPGRWSLVPAVGGCPSTRVIGMATPLTQWDAGRGSEWRWRDAEVRGLLLYTSEGWRQMIENPGDRAAAGGRGPRRNDGVPLLDDRGARWPGHLRCTDVVSAGAASAGVTSSGLITSKLHQLLDMDEAAALLDKAGTVAGYRRPGAEPASASGSVRSASVLDHGSHEDPGRPDPARHRLAQPARAGSNAA